MGLQRLRPFRADPPDFGRFRIHPHFAGQMVHSLLANLTDFNELWFFVYYVY